MMSGHGANPIFFNKKKIGRPEHSLIPTPTSNNISFLLHLSSLKVYAICVSPLTSYSSSCSYTNFLYFAKEDLK